MGDKGITELLPELRQQRGWSRERLSHEAFAVDREGTSSAQIAAIERGTRRASARTILALAKALDVSPDLFPEYRLAVARLALDEKQVGLDRALKLLGKSGIKSNELSQGEVRKFSRQGSRVDAAVDKARKTKKRVKRGK